MKKLLYILTGVVITVVALAGVGYAFAQGETPPDFLPQTPGGFGGRGRGAEMRSGAEMSGVMEDSPLHDVMSAAIADAFGLTVTELEAAHENGQNLWTLAEAQGLTQEEFQAKMFEVRESVFEQALADGLITQEQVDQMGSRQGQAGKGMYDPDQGGRPGQMGFAGMEDSPMHDLMSAAIVDAFGLTAEELEAAHENGGNLWTLAEAQGFTMEEFQAKMAEVRESVFQQAVEDGIITQEQVDQMGSRQGKGMYTPNQSGQFPPQGRDQGGCDGQCDW